MLNSLTLPLGVRRGNPYYGTLGRTDRSASSLASVCPQRAAQTSAGIRELWTSHNNGVQAGYGSGIQTDRFIYF